MRYSVKEIGILGFALMLTGCNFSFSNDRNNTESATPVWLSDVEIRDIEEVVTATGTAKAAKSADLVSETEGNYVLQRNPRTGKPYQLGDAVNAGEVLIRLESKSVENDVAIESKRLEVEIAKKELEGERSLLEKGGATELDVDNAENTYLTAQIALENAQISLDKMSIKAPFKGVITSLPYYTPNVLISSGTTLAQVMDYSTMYLEAQFPENNIEKLKVGQEVHVTNYNIKSDTLTAELTQLSPAIDETSRTFSGFIKIENPDLLLRPGMFAKADIVTEKHTDVIAIKKDIITKRRGTSVVYTVERTNAVENTIETGISDDVYVEVTKGLKEGDRVVTRGYDWLRNRSKVKVMQ